MEITWEPASSLSAQLIKEFEDGIACDLDTRTTSYRQHTCTLAIESQHAAPPMKKQKHNKPILESNTGVQLKSFMLPHITV